MATRSIRIKRGAQLLTPADVRRIRNLRRAGLRQVEIAKQFDITQARVSQLTADIKIVKEPYV